MPVALAIRGVGGCVVVNTLWRTGLFQAAGRGPVEFAPARTPVVERDRDAGLRARALTLGAWVQTRWRWYSIRSQLLIIVLAIEVAAAVVAGGITILKARTSTRVEIEASTRLAELFVTEAVQLVQNNAPPQRVLESLPLQLRFLRHVRISVRDAADVPVSQVESIARPDAPPKGERPPAPAWFQALIAPPVERHVVPVTAEGRRIGSVLIVSEPGDEIAEVWENTVALAWLALAVNAAIIGVLYVLFGRALAPLTGLVRGLTELERRNYTVRVPAPKTQEFIALAARFNALAQALATARADNIRLGQRLITAQDDERRHTALELHDEVGPSLFGLKATATSVAAAVANEPVDSMRHKIGERIRDMLAIIEHLQVINRSLLNRLRPMALGHVPLQDLVSQIIRDRARENGQIEFSFVAARLATSYGDTTDLTIYRCIQESLTNAIRHAQARTIVVKLGEGRPVPGCAGSERLELTVEDDGRGIAADALRGFGLTGMQERVQALGGEFALALRSGGGTVVQVTIPVEGQGSGGPRSDGGGAQ